MSDPRLDAAIKERNKAIDALHEAIYTIAGLAADKDSPFTSLYQQQCANVLPRLVAIRNELKA